MVDQPNDMSTNRPYLLRALHQWIVDNGMTPHILVNAEVDNIQVPVSAIRNGKVVLNVDPAAVQNLEIGNDYLTCSARFNGSAQSLFVPIFAILAVYARENGQGMMFADEVGKSDHDEQSQTSKSTSSNKDRSHLQVIK